MSNPEGYVPGGYGIGKDVEPHGSTGRQVMNLIPKNPTDKSTLVSIFPGRIKEVKSTIFPSEFIIPAAIENDFSISVIGGASWFLPNQNERLPPIEVMVNSYQLALSICLDWNSAILFYSPGVSEPGLFCIPGEWDKVSILKFVHRDTKKPFEQLLNDARIRQKAWFRALIESSDADWARTNGNPLAITEYARMGARMLKLEKPWNKDFEAISLSNCPYCGQLINPTYPTCHHCQKTINPARAAELDKLFGGMVKNG